MKLTVYLVFVDLDADFSGAELVNTFTFSQEHDSKLRAFRVVIDILSQLLVDLVISGRDVNLILSSDLSCVTLESIKLLLHIFKSLSQFIISTLSF
jgi:hypothetical protein